MFCHECSNALATGEPYVWIAYHHYSEGKPPAREQLPVCLDCAIKLDWLSHGQAIQLHGQEAA